MAKIIQFSMYILQFYESKHRIVAQLVERRIANMKTCGSKVHYCAAAVLFHNFFLLFFFFFAFFNAKLINHIILSRNVFFKFFDGIRGFLILTWDLEKKRRKVVVHHTPPQEAAP